MGNKQDILEAIRQSQPPMVTTEIVSKHINETKSTIYHHLEDLYKKGEIEKRKVGARAVVWWDPSIIADKPYVSSKNTVFYETIAVKIANSEKDGVIEQLESGQLYLHVDMEIDQSSDDRYWDKLNGRTSRGESVRLWNVSIESFSTNQMPSGIRFSVNGGAEINGLENTVVQQNEVRFSIDLNCFTVVRSPQGNWSPDNFKSVIEKQGISLNNNESIDWEFLTSPIPNFGYRIDSVKNHQVPIRTMKGRFNIEGIYGHIDRFADIATERVDDILALSRFFMGSKPNFSKIELVSIDGKSTDPNNGRFIYLRYPSVNTGSAFKRTQRFLPGITRRQIGSCYDEFLAVDDKYRLGYVLGAYVDAIGEERSIEGSFTNLCSAMEVLAERHAAKNQTGDSATQARLTTLMNDLNIETSDLAMRSDGFETRHLDGETNWHSSYHQEHNQLLTEYTYSAPVGVRLSIEQSHQNKSNPVPDRLKGSSGRFRFSSTHPSKEYFYQRSRNYLVHGDPQVTLERLQRDKMLVEVLLRRVIFNILFDDQHSEDAEFLLPPLEPTDGLLFFQ
jgi:hypothetical protein